MSDEQTPPPSTLRLKPRLRPAEPAAAVAAESAPTADAPAPAAVPHADVPAVIADSIVAALQPKIRLTPRLTAEAETPKPVESSPPAPFANAVVVAEAPAAVVPPVFAPDTLIGALPSEGSKLKLKPKGPAAEPPPAIIFPTIEPPTMPPDAVVPPPVVAAPPPPVVLSAPPAGGTPRKSVPPFPVVAMPDAVTTGSTKSSLKPPQMSMKLATLAAQAPVTAPVTPPPPPPPRVRRPRTLLAVAAVVVLGSGAFFGWQRFKPAPVAAAPAKAKAPAQTVAVEPKASAPAPAVAAPAPGSNAPAANKALTPSEALNKLAHAPANAINKAQEAIATRRASGQTRVDAASLGEDTPEKPAPTPKTATAQTSVAPGLAATVQVEAAPEANPAFRSFVANTKVSGVFQGQPAKAMINGRLVRVSETIDAGLGITLDSVDSDRKQLIFKDRSGATVARKY